jgi:hypothetical protein
MHALEKAPLILTETGARRLTDRIRQQLATVDQDLARAFECSAHQLLGYSSWAAYCAAEFPELEHVKLAVPARQERVKALRLVGASERAIADATGVSVGTVHTDLVELRTRGELDDAAAKTRGLDGRDRPAQQPATGPQLRAAAKVERHGLSILMHEAWQRVAGCEDAGMTCLELEKKTRWRHGRASSLLHRLERAGLVVRTGQFREDHGVYLARPLD